MSFTKPSAYILTYWVTFYNEPPLMHCYSKSRQILDFDRCVIIQITMVIQPGVISALTVLCICLFTCSSHYFAFSFSLPFQDSYSKVAFSEHSLLLSKKHLTFLCGFSWFGKFIFIENKLMLLCLEVPGYPFTAEGHLDCFLVLAVMIKVK